MERPLVIRAASPAPGRSRSRATSPRADLLHGAEPVRDHGVGDVVGRDADRHEREVRHDALALGRVGRLTVLGLDADQRELGLDVDVGRGPRRPAARARPRRRPRPRPRSACRRSSSACRAGCSGSRRPSRPGRSPERPRCPAASSALIAELARPSFAAKTASTSLFASVRICSMIVCACWLSQPGTCWSATSSQSPASTRASTVSA